ncbi:MAG: hypothetical protein CMJ58_24990 [Planctomycetaceae bacterium]|nr:hypothetical protein [Planctomycetaceae bacterium]
MRSLNVTWLLWYMSGMFVLLAIMASAITYHPDAQWEGHILSLAFAICSLVGCALAVTCGRLPPSHWVHKSQPVKVGIASVVVLVSVLAILLG